ncbi:MAG TPA: HPr family phosphocarrier protein [Actinomycetota bacterium]|nr:HPr family phosphocarrier protein [Actinomycetota bacterium]
MPEKEVKLTNEVGLHARPAAVFSKAAAGFSADVTVAKGGQEANAKSIMAVLKLDVKKGDAVTIATEGDGAEDALEELVTLLESL